MTTKLPLPQLNGDVLEYDKLQTDRVNGEADYIIEIGSTASGTWEKWASGKLVQRGVDIFKVNYVPNGNFGFYAAVNPAGTEAVKFHIPFVGSLATIVVKDSVLSNNCTGHSNFQLKLTGIQILYFYNGTAITGQDNRYSWEAIGRWK